VLLEDVDTYDPSHVLAGWANAELVARDGSVTPLAALGPARLERRPLQFRNQNQPLDGFAMRPDSRAVFDFGGRSFARFRGTAGVDTASYRSDVLAKIRFFIFDEEPDMQQLVRVASDPPVPFAAWRYPADQLTARLFQYALLRDPLPKERQTAARLLAGKDGRISSDGLEDLLWSVFLLPEFQYVR
jgi:hypothetical protein